MMSKFSQNSNDKYVQEDPLASPVALLENNENDENDNSSIHSFVLDRDDGEMGSEVSDAVEIFSTQFVSPPSRVMPPPTLQPSPPKVMPLSLATSTNKGGDLQEMELFLVTNKPKRSLNCYNYFFQHHRRLIYEDLPPGTKPGFKGLATIISQRWRNITPSEKAHFNAMAQQDKARFQREKKAWEKLRLEHTQRVVEAARQEQKNATKTSTATATTESRTNLAGAAPSMVAMEATSAPSTVHAAVAATTSNNGQGDDEWQHLVMPQHMIKLAKELGQPKEVDAFIRHFR